MATRHLLHSRKPIGIDTEIRNTMLCSVHNQPPTSMKETRNVERTKVVSRHGVIPELELTHSKSYISSDVLKILADSERDPSIFQDLKKFDSPKIQSRIDLGGDRQEKKPT